MAVFTIPKPEKVDVPSSNRHMPISKTTSFAPGTLVPIMCKDILPGDRVRINLDSLIESLPMVVPNLNGYKASFDFYFCPWSNYYGWMDNNKRLSTDDLLNRARWTYGVGGAEGMSDTSSLEEWDLVMRGRPDQTGLVPGAVQPGSLLDGLGISPGFVGQLREGSSAENFAYQRRSFPAEKLISLLDIYRTYYVNNQEENCYFVNSSFQENLVEGGLIRVPLKVLDELTIKLRQAPDGSDIVIYLNQFPLPETISVNGVNLVTYGQLIDALLVVSQRVHLGGLPLRTYRMDLNRGLLSQTVGAVKSRVTITDGGFDVDTLRFANKMQKLIDRIDISGGRFSDMMRARWGVTPRNTLNVPDFLGSCSSFFGVTDVISTASGMNSEVENGRGNSVLGQQAGFAVGKVKRDNTPISFFADNYGTLMCVFSLVPIVTYSQGIEAEDLKISFTDIYDPAFAQLGYQDVSPLELNALPTLDFTVNPDMGADETIVRLDSSATTASVGKRVAWAEYMSSLPRAHGLFAYGQAFDYWVNNRRYSRYVDTDASVGDPASEEAFVRMLPYGPQSFSTYVNPATQNNLFAEVGLTAQNFRLRASFDMNMRREIGSRVMGHL